ncbi:uncharacterized protein [Tenebrio molitor]|jgi:phosphatidylinositol glycan class W|uniref:uncharacterized protein n=1 Tax=Tenebrio molitor TaxID=7067 RepID=UPI003624A35F
MDERRVFRDRLMHSDGTTPFETISLILPTFFYTTITTIVVSILRSRTHNLTLQFCTEFATLVIPIILNVTILADYTLQLLSTSCIICLSLLFWLRTCKTPPNRPPEALTRDYITNSRSTIHIISVVAILAVDFLVFPRRFAKTETFGYSLMDVGVGLFMFSNGIVDGGRTTLRKAFTGSLPLIAISVLRWLTTTLFNYHVPVSEYGVHWNFFVTLAFCRILVSLFFTVVDVRFVWINATLLMVSHETLLQSGLQNFVLSDAKRTTLFEANKEGIVSVAGYICLYLYSAYFSHLVGLKRGGETTKKTTLKFAILSILTLLLSMICQKQFGISRRLANSAYCFWILFIGIFMTGLYYVTGKILEEVFTKKLRIQIHLPFIFQAINYNGLAFFLVSNLLTGLVNIFCDTLKVDPLPSLVIISIYMLVNCALVCYFYTKQIKWKL